MDKEERDFRIYKITNTKNKKIYIGQTILSPKQKWKTYFKEFKYSKKARYIIRAMRKYGFEAFVFEIIEDNIKTKQEVDKKEIYYIREYNSANPLIGYNEELGGNGPGKHSEETKRKISEAQIGEKNHMYGRRGAENKTSKPVLEVTTGQLFGSAMLAADYFGVNFSHVCAVARGERGSTGERVFRYLDKSGNPIKPEKTTHIKNPKVRQSVKPEYQYLL